MIRRTGVRAHLRKSNKKVSVVHRHIRRIRNFFSGHLDKEALQNDNFRKVLYTGDNEQLVVMSIKPGEDIGDEVHQKVDQFIRVEGGNARFIINGKKVLEAGDGGSVVIPAGSYHNVVNTGRTPLKLYTVYSPPNHPRGTIDRTKKDAILREKEGE